MVKINLFAIFVKQFNDIFLDFQVVVIRVNLENYQNRSLKLSSDIESIYFVVESGGFCSFYDKRLNFNIQLCQFGTLNFVWKYYCDLKGRSRKHLRFGIAEKPRLLSYCHFRTYLFKHNWSSIIQDMF